MTEFPVTALRSVDLAVPSLAQAEAFYTAVWGLEVAERRCRSLYLRATGCDHHVLGLHEGPAAIRSITFRAESVAALEAVVARAPAAGGRVLQGVAGVDWAGGGVGVVVADADGRVLRVVHGDDRRPVGPGPVDPPARDRPSRLSHVNVNSRDTDATARFFEAVLRFRLTDRSKMMAFVRCNSDHHCVVIADAPVDGLNHVAFLLPTLEGVMVGSGRLVDHGHPIAWGVGRHGPGDNVFAYFVDPFGIVVEYTAEVLQVDDGYRVRGPSEWVWPPGRTDQWGIAPPKSDALKQAQLAIPFAPWVA